MSSRINKIKPRVSDAVDGGEGTEIHRDRSEEHLDHRFGYGRELSQGDTSDFYQPGRRVSVEEARLRQLSLQEGMDQQVVDENRFPEDPEHVTRRGLPPCQRVNDEGTRRGDTPGRRR